jgi:hypothetical protein
VVPRSRKNTQDHVHVIVIHGCAVGLDAETAALALDLAVDHVAVRVEHAAACHQHEVQWQIAVERASLLASFGGNIAAKEENSIREEGELAHAVNTIHPVLKSRVSRSFRSRFARKKTFYSLVVLHYGFAPRRSRARTSPLVRRNETPSTQPIAKSKTRQTLSRICSIFSFSVVTSLRPKPRSWSQPWPFGARLRQRFKN